SDGCRATAPRSAVRREGEARDERRFVGTPKRGLMKIEDQVAKNAIAGWTMLALTLLLTACGAKHDAGTEAERLARSTNAQTTYPPVTVAFDVAFPEPSPGAAGIALAARDSLAL